MLGVVIVWHEDRARRRLRVVERIGLQPGRKCALILHQQRSLRRRSSVVLFAPRLPAFLDPLPWGGRAGTPCVPCPRTARSFEGDTDGKEAKIPPCRRPVLHPRRC